MYNLPLATTEVMLSNLFGQFPSFRAARLKGIDTEGLRAAFVEYADSKQLATRDTDFRDT